MRHALIGAILFLGIIASAAYAQTAEERRAQRDRARAGASTPAPKKPLDAPDMTGTWTGISLCPLGLTGFVVSVNGSQGTFFTGYPRRAVMAQPVAISSFEGHQGMWVRFNVAHVYGISAMNMDGLVSPNGSMLAVEGPGGCGDFKFERETIAASISTTTPLQPSKGGPPNGDSVIEAVINEIVLTDGSRLGFRRALLGGSELSFGLARIHRCNPLKMGIYQCTYTLDMTAHRGIYSIWGEVAARIANDRMSKEPVTHQFVYQAGTWRSPTYKQQLDKVRQEIANDTSYDEGP